VLPLASRHHSLNMSEVADVIAVLAAFEEHNSVSITMELGLLRTGKEQTLLVTVAAWQKGDVGAERALLSLATVNTSRTNLKTLSAVLTHALYQTDFKLAEREFDIRGKKEA